MSVDTCRTCRGTGREYQPRTNQAGVWITCLDCYDAAAEARAEAESMARDQAARDYADDRMSLYRNPELETRP